MKIDKDPDLVRGFPPSSLVASAQDDSSCALEDQGFGGGDSLAWNGQNRRWNGMPSWGAKVENYLKSGFVTPRSIPGFAENVPNFQTCSGRRKDDLNQYDDGEMIVYVGQLYNVADLAAAYERLRLETSFVVPDATMVVDPRVPGRAFLAITKVDCTDGRSLEYQITGANADDCMNLVSEITALLQEAKEVLQDEFFVDLHDPSNWGLTDEGMSRARSRWPLAQSELVILKPIR